MGDYFSIRGNEYHVPFADRCLDNKAYRSYFIHKTYQSAACIQQQGGVYKRQIWSRGKSTLEKRIVVKSP